MESTTQSHAKAKCPEEKSFVKIKTSRGISAKACVAKAKDWKLESIQGPPKHEANTSETSLP